ncbi:(2Fe-2S) ferredoxin domain-containing protein [Novosphingobium album (ex Liu et al. 2023)]|uniref:(2Fe-2S) ferredoxin domain-containing protein n=1 Tax=Novosphingobium album (ex Liu et al. 2023) TaxID=3031130 RepID=A0ABT5WLD1_9SPHN|nr:(2Fe-2S) ferredoxin domain-containing protein [Novosphingobium album (ex Liu et al. 2023)]MDE8650859.1 (2Fe-2S) ferredoxin domain-containing protein [Novosphingobium album (ex Liu et al. 2023)]
MKRVPAQWSSVTLVCRKCSKRCGGGFGKNGRTSLAKALLKRGNGKKGRKASIGVVEVDCLKVCPKNAVVAIDGAHPQEWVVVPKGTDISLVARRLGIDGKR